MLCSISHSLSLVVDLNAAAHSFSYKGDSTANNCVMDFKYCYIFWSELVPLSAKDSLSVLQDGM